MSFPLGDVDQRLVICTGYANFNFSSHGSHAIANDAIIRFPIIDTDFLPLKVTKYAPTTGVAWIPGTTGFGTVIVAPASLDEWDDDQIRFYTDNPILGYMDKRDLLRTRFG